MGQGLCDGIVQFLLDGTAVGSIFAGIAPNEEFLQVGPGRGAVRRRAPVGAAARIPQEGWHVHHVLETELLESGGHRVDGSVELK